MDEGEEMIQSLSLVGKKKTAKSTVALSAPLPIVYFDFEIGLRRVEPRYLPDMSKVTVHNIEPVNQLKLKADPDLAIKHWEKILRLYNTALEDPNIKSIVFDTFTAMWEAKRMAHLGAIRKTEPSRSNLNKYEYFVPNTEMKELFVQASLHEKVLITIHHTTAEYMAGEETGEETADGWKQTGDLVDVEFWMTKVRKDGKTIPRGEFRTCGPSMAVEGMTMDEPTFAEIDALVEGYRSLK